MLRIEEHQFGVLRDLQKIREQRSWRTFFYVEDRRTPIWRSARFTKDQRLMFLENIFYVEDQGTLIWRSARSTKDQRAMFLENTLYVEDQRTQPID